MLAPLPIVAGPQKSKQTNSGLFRLPYLRRGFRCLTHTHVQAVLGAVHPLQLLKMLPGITNVDEGSGRG